MIECRDVWKRYGRTVALRGVSLRVARGGILYLAGANGAGKSTILRIAARIALPDRGRLRIAAHRTAYVGHRAQLLAGLSVRANLRYQAELFGAAWADVEAYAATFAVDAFWERRPGALSRGMRQRVILARAFAVRADLLLLDEPETGLDREGVAVLWQHVAAEAERGVAVLVATHTGLPASLEARADVLLLRNGARV